MAFTVRLQRRIVLLLATASLACAPAPRSGDEVRIAEESAIIIWDAAGRTQHFIRRASFETRAKDFGFLVPTPSVPDLAEADDKAFRMLQELTEPPARAPEPAPKAEAPKSIEVIAKVKVAGYDAAVLAANDADALDKWLKANDYQSNPALVDWYRPYIEKKWIITAFKISREPEQSARVDGSAVRMSFKTEQPFFPYREPAAAAGDKGGPRLLRIFYLGDMRPEGKLGTDEAWPVKAAWSAEVTQAQRAELFHLLKLPEPTAGGARRLTLFNDSSSPRPGKEDLFFSAAPDQAELRESPDAALQKQIAKRRSNLALLIVFIATGLLAAFVWWRVAKRK